MSEANRSCGFDYTIDGTALLDLLAEASFVIGYLGGDLSMPLTEENRNDMSAIAERLRKARDAVLANQKAVLA